MAEPSPAAKRLFEFDRLNRAARRALASRARHSRRTPFEQWCWEHPLGAKGSEPVEPLYSPTAPDRGIVVTRNGDLGAVKISVGARAVQSSDVIVERRRSTDAT